MKLTRRQLLGSAAALTAAAAASRLGHQYLHRLPPVRIHRIGLPFGHEPTTLTLPHGAQVGLAVDRRTCYLVLPHDHGQPAPGLFGVDPAGNDQVAHRAWQCWCGQPHEG